MDSRMTGQICILRWMGCGIIPCACGMIFQCYININLSMRPLTSTSRHRGDLTLTRGNMSQLTKNKPLSYNAVYNVLTNEIFYSYKLGCCYKIWFVTSKQCLPVAVVPDHLVLPHKYFMPQSWGMTPKPVTVYKYRINLYLCYPLMWSSTLKAAITHLEVLSISDSTDTSITSHTFHTSKQKHNQYQQLRPNCVRVLPFLSSLYRRLYALRYVFLMRLLASFHSTGMVHDRWDREVPLNLGMMIQDMDCRNWKKQI